MKKVIVDTSIWISFFKGEDSAKIIFPLLDSNQICINDLILSELIPSLKHRRENQIVDMIESIERVELKIVWSQISEMQVINLKSGINKVGIPDLIIAQNALQNDLSILSLDKHFQLMKENIGLKIYGST
jgi:predicted nucleic acid-binding protein